MLSQFAKFLLFATSIAPVFVTFGFVELLQSDSSWLSAVSYFAGSGALVLLCWWILRVAKANVQRLPFQPVSIKSVDSVIVGFLVTYLLPLVTWMNPQFTLVVGVFCVTKVLLWARVCHRNPLLSLFGYTTYEVTDTTGTTYFLLCKRKLQTKELRNVIQLTERMILDVSSGVDPS